MKKLEKITSFHELTNLNYKTKLNSKEALIYKSLINSWISHDNFVSVNKELRMIEAKYEVYDGKKVIFFKAQEVSWIKYLSY